MAKIWYCPNCGYEVTGRGRCHQCKERLVASPLPELAAGEEDDEVGYRIADWTDAARGWLITALIDVEIPHRFEDDELVVSADDEAATDDLMAQVVTEVRAGGADQPPDRRSGSEAAVSAPDGADAAVRDEAVGPAMELLRTAAHRLHQDPTDMEADGEVAEASAVVFQHDTVAGLPDDTWAAVGRVTRRLLSALGAEDALEDEIRLQAGVLGKLLDPADAGGALGASPPTIYELPEWLPEQRGELSLLLDEQAIAHRWNDEELLIPTERETEVERLFDRVAPLMTTEEDDDDRYHDLEELFAAADRLANSPADEDRAADVVARVQVVDGPTPLGFDDAQWWTIRSKAHALVGVVESEGHPDVIAAGAAELRDLLRAMV